MNLRYQSLYARMIGRSAPALFEKYFGEMDEEKFNIDQEYNGKPLLHHAAANRQKEIVLFLLQKGANIHSKQKESGKSILHEAISDPEILELLLLNGADSNSTDNSGNTPLHIVSNEKSMSVLLQYKANPNAKNKLGSTPLHEAAWIFEEPDDLMIVRLLLEHGANADEKNSEGQTPKDVALRVNHMNCFKALREYKKTPVKYHPEKVAIIKTNFTGGAVSTAPSGGPSDATKMNGSHDSMSVVSASHSSVSTKVEKVVDSNPPGGPDIYDSSQENLHGEETRNESDTLLSLSAAVSQLGIMRAPETKVINTTENIRDRLKQLDTEKERAFEALYLKYVLGKNEFFTAEISALAIKYKLINENGIMLEVVQKVVENSAGMEFLDDGSVTLYLKGGLEPKNALPFVPGGPGFGSLIK